MSDISIRPDSSAASLPASVSFVEIENTMRSRWIPTAPTAPTACIESVYKNDIWSAEKEFPAEPLLQISSHVKFALSKAFSMNHTHAILLEEDLVVAPDLLTLFRSTGWLLNADDSLFCVSAWNDNGFVRHVRNETRIGQDISQG